MKACGWWRRPLGPGFPGIGGGGGGPHPAPPAPPLAPPPHPIGSATTCIGPHAPPPHIGIPQSAPPHGWGDLLWPSLWWDFLWLTDFAAARATRARTRINDLLYILKIDE